MCLAGFSSPTHGSVQLDGRDITSMVPERRNFGVVFQGYALFPHLSIAGNIAFPLHMRGFDRAARVETISRMLKLVKLEGYADRKPAELSGGQQQRVALARALSFDPSIVLLDEPLSALDRALRETLRAELRQIHRSTGATFVMVTHDQEEALSISDQVIVLNHGRVIQQGSPREVYDRPKSLFAAKFVGKTNLIRVTIESAASAACSAAHWTGRCSRWLARSRHKPASSCCRCALKPCGSRRESAQGEKQPARQGADLRSKGSTGYLTSIPRSAANRCVFARSWHFRLWANR